MSGSAVVFDLDGMLVDSIPTVAATLNQMLREAGRAELPIGSFYPWIRKGELPYVRCNQHNQMDEAIRNTLSHSGPAVCEVIIDEHLSFAPKLGSRELPNGKMESSPLEDLSPFLSRDELADNTPYVDRATRARL